MLNGAGCLVKLGAMFTKECDFMEQTTNYGLKKFGYDDGADIALINENMDVIDNVLGRKVNGNGAVWYATKVVQNATNPHFLDITIQNFVFTEGCELVFKLPTLNKNNISDAYSWIITVESTNKHFRLVSGDSIASNTIPRDLLQGNQIIKVTLSESIVDPINSNNGTAFLLSDTPNRHYYSLEQLGFKDSDFAIDTVDDAILKVITAIPRYGELICYLRGTQEPGVAEDGFFNFWNLINTKIISDLGYAASEWVLSIKRGAWSVVPNKITVYCNSYEGDRTVELSTFHDNTLGTFKPVNIGSNKNLLHNWDFRNPVNQRGETEYIITTTTASHYTVDRWRTYMLAGEAFTASVQKNGVKTSAIGGNYRFSQPIENECLYAGKIITFSVKYAEDSMRNSGVSVIYNGVEVAGSGWKERKAGEIVSVTTTLPMYSTSGFRVQWGGQPNGFCVIEQAKLEFGSVSTLANDSPADYGEQLALCQRYYRKIAIPQSLIRSDAGQLSHEFNFDIPLRSTPAVKFINDAYFHTTDNQIIPLKKSGERPYSVEYSESGHLIVWILGNNDSTSITRGLIGQVNASGIKANNLSGVSVLELDANL